MNCDGLLVILKPQIYKKLRITFLGTGTSQGVPVIACNCDVCQSKDSRDKRLRSSVMVEVSGKTLVIDTGPDFRQQMLRQNVKNLNAVLFTHGHKDHIGGLDDVRAFNYIQKRAMDVFARKEVNADVEREFSYAFTDEKYPGVPEIVLHEIYTEPFLVDDILIIPIEVRHFELLILGYRINDFVYITDASKIAAEELDKMRNARILVINGLRKKSHYSHFNLEEALQVINNVRPQQAYITHISHQMGLQREVQAELPENVFLAFDGLKLDFPDPF